MEVDGLRGECSAALRAGLKVLCGKQAGRPPHAGMQRLIPLLVFVAAIGYGQQVPFDRLPVEEFDVTPPTQRVSGEAGKMRTLTSPCRSLPLSEVRRRVVDVAVQEWGFFGFPIVDQSVEVARPAGARRRGRFRGGNPEEGARVAASIGGYWAVTPEGSWIVDQQNQSWNGPSGLGSRWRSPWSAAFISWVMCEAGLGDKSQFQRAVAHVTYIDQAIRARDGAAAAAFVAYDLGEKRIEPGDLLCSSRRPVFHSIAERRSQMGEGARGHCDIVVKLDGANQRILTVGGNVGGRVSLKIMPAVMKVDLLRPSSSAIFAHLKLRAGTVEAAALDNTPTMTVHGCSRGIRAANLVRAMSLISVRPRTTSC